MSFKNVHYPFSDIIISFTLKHSSLGKMSINQLLFSNVSKYTQRDSTIDVDIASVSESTTATRIWNIWQTGYFYYSVCDVKELLRVEKNKSVYASSIICPHQDNINIWNTSSLATGTRISDMAGADLATHIAKALANMWWPYLSNNILASVSDEVKSMD